MSVRRRRRRQLMAQEGRDRNSFRARGPSAEEKNVQRDKSRSTLSASESARLFRDSELSRITSNATPSNIVENVTL